MTKSPLLLAIFLGFEELRTKTCSSYTPAPPQILLNDRTKKCILMPSAWGCNELCLVRYDWRSIGATNRHEADDLGEQCPVGYEPMDMPPSNAFYCQSMYQSNDEICCGCFGECGEILVVNNELEKCSYSLCVQLPAGWSMASEEGLRCDWDSWVEQSHLDCNNPCPNASTCSECLSLGCTWSHEMHSCDVLCAGSSWDGSCLAAPQRNVENPLNDDEFDAEALCADLSNVYHDDQMCQRQLDCGACSSTPLPSDDTRTCRWVSTCEEGTSGRYCELCTANSCELWSRCRDIKDCNESLVCSSLSCSSCLENGCFWSATQGCFRTCPETDDACISLPEEGSILAAQTMCRELETLFWDKEFCIERSASSVNACVGALLPSDTASNCGFYVYLRSENDSYEHTICSTACPNDDVHACRTTDELPCMLIRSCTECLSADYCFWVQDWDACEDHCSERNNCISSADTLSEVQQQQCSNHNFYDKCTHLQSCSECLSDPDCYWTGDGCANSCPEGETVCLSHADILSDQQTTIDFCLTNHFGSSRGLEACDRSYHVAHKILESGKPCNHCLIDNCSWGDGRCQHPSDDLFGDHVMATDLIQDGHRLEDQIISYCTVVDCIGATTCFECLTRNCVWADNACYVNQECSNDNLCIAARAGDDDSTIREKCSASTEQRVEDYCSKFETCEACLNSPLEDFLQPQSSQFDLVRCSWFVEFGVGRCAYKCLAANCEQETCDGADESGLQASCVNIFKILLAMVALCSFL